MAQNKIKNQQVLDANENVIRNANGGAQVTSSTTTEVHAAGTKGVLLAVQIGTDVDGGTFWFTDGSDAAIDGLPSATGKYKTDYPGKIHFDNMEFTNGLKIVTADFTGGVLHVRTWT